MCQKNLLIFLLFLLMSISLGAEMPTPDAIKKKGGIRYLCTGIGESKDDPRSALFPLKIVFASNSSALYSDITIRISKENGETVFENFCEGAWLLAELPPGKYKVVGIDTRKLERSCLVTLGSSQTQCTLRWPN